MKWKEKRKEVGEGDSETNESFYKGNPSTLLEYDHMARSYPAYCITKKQGIKEQTISNTTLPLILLSPFSALKDNTQNKAKG